MMQQTGLSGLATAAPVACATPAPSMPNLNVERIVFGTRISWNIMAHTAVLPPSATSTEPSGKTCWHA